MKNFYPIQVLDLRHQVDHITPKKVHFGKNGDIPDNARCFAILIGHRKFRMVSNCNKITEIEVFRNDNT